MSRIKILHGAKSTKATPFLGTKSRRKRTLELLAALMIAGTTTAYADVLSLGAMTQTDGVKYQGPFGEANAGSSAAGIGDMNGDGFGEAVIGAAGNYVYTYNALTPPNPQGHGTHAGSSFVVFGGSTLGVSVPTADLRILAAGNPAGNPTLFPPASTPAKAFRIDGRACYGGVTAVGVTNKGFGRNVVAVGDVNADGFGDFLVGAQKDTGDGAGIFGRAYIIFGRATTPSGATAANILLDERNPSGTGANQYNFASPSAKGMIINGVGGELGTSVAGLGDFNGDGIADFAIGAPALTVGANANAGSVFVVFGSATLPSTINLSTLGTAGFRIDGDNANDYAGAHISGAGDFNGDGKKDLIIGGDVFEQAVGGATNDGGAFIVFGRAGSGTLAMRTAAGTYLKGLGTGKYSGVSVSGNGNFNGDGFSDVIVGTTGAYNAAVSTNSGVGTVVFGSSAPPALIDLNTITQTTGVKIFGAANDYAGSSVAFVGDTNGDGKDDVLVGAEGAKNGATLNTGAAYLVFGAVPTASTFSYQADSTKAAPHPDRSFLGAATGDKTGRFVGPAGDMNGDGKKDFFIGAPQATVVTTTTKTTAGIAYLIMGKTVTVVTEVIDWQMF